MDRFFQTKAVFEYSKGTRRFVQRHTGTPALPQALPDSLGPRPLVSRAQGWRNATLPLLLWGSPQSQQELGAQVAELHLIMLSMCPWIQMQRFRAKHYFLHLSPLCLAKSGLRTHRHNLGTNPPDHQDQVLCDSVQPPCKQHTTPEHFTIQNLCAQAELTPDTKIA